jgi:hypothetical protein
MLDTAVCPPLQGFGHGGEDAYFYARGRWVLQSLRCSSSITCSCHGSNNSLALGTFGGQFWEQFSGNLHAADAWLTATLRHTMLAVLLTFDYLPASPVLQQAVWNGGR